MSFWSNATFHVSAAEATQFPEPKAWEFVVVGRSNVGKSSLINRITGHHRLAYVGKQPGKTRLINFYAIEAGYLVDVPGYGYAQRSQAELKRYGRLMEGYFKSRPITAVLMLLDSRHDLSKEDEDMLNYLKSLHLPMVLVANKLDKLNQSDLSQAKKRYAAYDLPVLFFSALHDRETQTLRDWIEARIPKPTSLEDSEDA
jgi:GTP-binding protein